MQRKMIRVLIIDDHALVRSGIRALLEKSGDIEVVGEAGDGYEALNLMSSLEPDIALLDISMPKLNGLEVAARAKKEFPEVRIVFLSMHVNEEYVLQALKVGAAGYVLKNATTSELELAVRSARKGETFLSPAVSNSVVADYVARLRGACAAKPAVSPYDRLTGRQREILQLIAEGCTTKEIAQKLGLSINTVEVHRTNLMERLNIHDIAGLVRYAIVSGVIQCDC
ncbi:MAG: response regulator transcription factor [Syntrophorhabdales bacterium]|jgi:DNA-binding NarL/FixJ family response regulator